MTRRMLIAEITQGDDFEERVDEVIVKVESRFRSVFNDFVESPSVTVIA
jgi:hypothetical protein